MRTVITFFTLFIAISFSLPVFAQIDGAVKERQYAYGDGEPAFVLRQPLFENRTYDASLQLSEADEIWILDKSQGARGTVLYRNDTGRVFLRVNHTGGATLYPTPDSMGIPVLRKSEYRFEVSEPAVSEDEANLTSIEDWSRVYGYAGNKKTDRDGTEKKPAEANNIQFTDWPASKTAYKTELIRHLSKLLETDNPQNIEKITVKIGDQPATAQDEKGLTIWVNPALGLAGRPSTEKILSNISEIGG